jgi:transcriptional regulator
VSDAPPDFTQRLIAAVVGIEIVITRLTGKWKVSQNQPHENQVGVVQGLRKSSSTRAQEMAALVEGAKNAR